jgi:arsenate reductase (thioredoxin)
MKKILFVCQANVGRSQMAEGFYNFLTQSKNAISAGAEDFAKKYNYRPTPEIIEAIAEKGIDISGQRIKFLTPDVCDDVERIVVLCDKQFCPTFLLNNPKVIFREVTDPFGQKTELICQIRDEIEIIVKALL